MADVYTMDDPSILLGATELKCHASKVALIPTDNFVDVSTFCNAGGEKPSTTTWELTVTIKQSFAADGAWNLLNALPRGSTQTLVLKPDDAAVAVGNPSATCSVYMPSVPFVDSEIGEASEFDLTFKVIGQPVFATA